MGGTNGTCKAASAVTAWEAAAAAAERCLAASCFRNRSSRAETGGLTKDLPLRVVILKGLKETSDKDSYLPTRKFICRQRRIWRFICDLHYCTDGCQFERDVFDLI